MKIHLRHEGITISPRITSAYNHKTKKSVEIGLEGSPGAYETTLDSIDVAADCLVHRGWKLVSPPVLACPVIRNYEGLMFPDEFVFTAKEGRLTRDQVRAASDARSKKAPEKKIPEKKLAEGGFAAESAPNVPPAGGDEAAA